MSSYGVIGISKERAPFNCTLVGVCGLSKEPLLQAVGNKRFVAYNPNGNRGNHHKPYTKKKEVNHGKRK